MKDEAIDVLVIGAGAAGASLSWRLTEKGAKVVCLEQGGWILPAATIWNDWPGEVLRCFTHAELKTAFK